MLLQEVVQLLQAAIEASVYVAPTEPGLTASDLYEVGRRLGLKDGVIGDALPNVSAQLFGQPDERLLLPEYLWHMPGYLLFAENPDLRSPIAFDFVTEQLNDLAWEVGTARARLDRRIIVDRGRAKLIEEHDIQVAITLMVLSGQLVEDRGVIRFKGAQGERPLPSTNRNQHGVGPRPRSKVARTRAMPHVKDVVARRTDGRPKHVEPFGAFAKQLEKLGYGPFRLWWGQTVAELDRTDSVTSPLSTLVLAAALVEGSLTFIVKHARTLGLATFASNDFARDPRLWRIDELVASAARGGDSAVLDPPNEESS